MFFIRQKFVKILALTLFMVCIGLTNKLWAESVVVQVMSVSNVESARGEATRLMANGVPSFQRQEDVPGTGVRYRVYLGPFDSREEALSAVGVLKEQGLVKDYIVRVEGAAAPELSGVPAVGAAPAAQNGAAWPAPAQPPVQGNAQGTEVWPAPAQANAQGTEVWPAPVQPPVQGNAQGTEVWPAPVQPPVQANAQGTEVWPAPAQVNAQGTEVWPAPAQANAQGNAAWPASAQTPQPLPSNVPVLPLPDAQSVQPQPPVTQSVQSLPVAPVVPVAPVPASKSAKFSAQAAAKLRGFAMIVDLSSSMRRMSPCVGGLVKQEAVSTLLRKMNHRIPPQPYMSALRVFGYKQIWSKDDYSILYYGPSVYDRNGLELAIGRLFAADSVSPFGWAISASAQELSTMESPRAVLMFADFEESTNAGGPDEKARSIRSSLGQDIKFYTFHVTRVGSGVDMAKKIAAAGGGKTWSVCDMLNDQVAFENMMNEIFGPNEAPPCSDVDSDGVCDEQDLCPNTPIGAQVDERGCWIAAYSQFFDFDKADVKIAYHSRLKHAVEIIKNNPNLSVVTIAGHTDAKGTETYNLDLGRRRAESVRELMIKFGAPAEKMVVESFGKSRPIADNNTEEGRSKNRRVEFHVGDVPK